MEIFKEIEPLRAYLRDHKEAGESIGLVPTMGALHPGHLSLIEASKKETQTTVCSIFINPTQFNNPADLANYPRSMTSDLATLDAAGCHVVFSPSTEEMYSDPKAIHFDFGNLDKKLEGEFRPGHFSGVALAVSKLFNIVRPHIAFFGQKDFQQFKIISKLNEELKFDIALRCIPIFREADGLAMSSRNLRLDADQRQRAVVLYESLLFAKEMIARGKTFDSIINDVRELFKHAGAKLEYLAWTDTENLNPVKSVNQADHSILLIAGYVGDVRLIDNMTIS